MIAIARVRNRKILEIVYPQSRGATRRYVFHPRHRPCLILSRSETHTGTRFVFRQHVCVIFEERHTVLLQYGSLTRRKSASVTLCRLPAGCWKVRQKFAHAIPESMLLKRQNDGAILLLLSSRTLDKSLRCSSLQQRIVA